MKIDFDLKKDLSNIEKHGVSLQQALALEWDEALIWEDTRRDYGEKRICALVPLQTRVYYAVFVERDGFKRMISLRKANKREVQRYAYYG